MAKPKKGMSNLPPALRANAQKVQKKAASKAKKAKKAKKT